jgi:SAM-dependent methyltransferase
MSRSSNTDYLLGVNQTELERLQFQHRVWQSVTDKFFDRLNIRPGWKCLDVGAGPGFVAVDLRTRVGDRGEVTALEPSTFYLDWFRGQSKVRGWTNIKYIQGRAEEADLPEGYFDLVFSRWVISFVPDPETFLARLIASLKPGGIIALQDYYYEGLSLYPIGGPFDRMRDAVKTYYRSQGGDPYIAGKIPMIFRKHGVRVIDYTPNCLAGGPESGITEWADRFFSVHTQAMIDRGIINQKEGEAILADWRSHREDPDAVFFSPIVVDTAGLLD